MMSDLKQYVEKRKAVDPEFAENYETGYLEQDWSSPSASPRGGWFNPRRGRTKIEYQEVRYLKNGKPCGRC